MKIALITPAHPYSERPCGIGRYLRDYIDELVKVATVSLISVEPGPEIAGCDQHLLKKSHLPSPLLPIIYSFQISKILKKFKPDLVEYPNYGGLGCMDRGPWTKAVRLSTPVREGSPRNGILPKVALPIHNLWEKLTVSNADLWISNSDANLIKCKSLYKVERESKIIPHGIVPNSYNCHRKSNDLIFTGRFESRKGLKLLLKAWEGTSKKHEVESCLHIVGSDTSGKSGSYLKDCVQAVSIPAERIKIHGELSEKKLHHLRLQCSITVIPSRYESFGMVCLEGFAYNHIVLASNVGGLAEIITDGENGILVDPECVNSWVDAFEQAIFNQQLKDTLALAGNKSLMEQFSVEAMARKSVRAYKKAIEVKQSES